MTTREFIIFQKIFKELLILCRRDWRRWKAAKNHTITIDLDGLWVAEIKFKPAISI